MVTKKKVTPKNPVTKPFSGLSRHAWEALVSEYRIQGPKHGAVSKAAGIKADTAKRYWLYGGRSARRPWCLEPIKDIVERDRLALRAELQLDRETAERSTALELGKLDALRARADIVSEQVSNVQLARAVKAQVLDLATMVQQVLDGIGGAAAEGLRAIFDGNKFRELALDDPDKALRQVRSLGKIVKEMAETTETVVKLERLLLGESTENTKHEHQVAHTFETQGDALAVIRRANAAALRVQGHVVDVEARVLGVAGSSK